MWESIQIKNLIMESKETKQIYSIRYPHIFGMKSKIIEPKINRFIKHTALNIYESHKEWSEVNIDYKIKFREYNLLGLLFTIEIYNKGAAHPLYKAKYFCINLETGDPFEFKDLFRTGYKTAINSIIIEILQNKGLYFPCQKNINKKNDMQKALQLVLGYKAPVCFNTVKDNEFFYISDMEIVIVFPQYTIAPGVHGNIEIPVKLEKISSIINPNGPLRIFY